LRGRTAMKTWGCQDKGERKNLKKEEGCEEAVKERTEKKTTKPRLIFTRGIRVKKEERKHPKSKGKMSGKR